MIAAMRNKVFIMIVGALVLLAPACRKKTTADALLSPDPEIREAALQTLRKQPDNEKVQYVATLIIGLHDNDSLVVQKSIDALKVVGPVAAPAIKPVLADSDPFVRAAAIEILTAYAPQDSSLKPVIADMVKDPHPFVHDEADFAVKQLKIS